MQVRTSGYTNTKLFKYSFHIETIDLKLIGAEPKLHISCYGICNKFVLSKVEVLKTYYR